MPTPRDCPETYDGTHGKTGTDGRCLFCRRKVEAASPRPDRWTWVTRSPLIDAYRRTYDPDWGSAQYDQDPL